MSLVREADRLEEWALFYWKSYQDSASNDGKPSIDFQLLTDSCPLLAQQFLFKHPRKIWELLLKHAPTDLVGNASDLRLEHFPRSLFTNTVPQSADCHKLIGIYGTVTRTGTMKVVERHARFQCELCHATVQVDFDWTIGEYPRPYRCSAEDCTSTRFSECPADHTTIKEYSDIQEIRIQEQMEHLALGTVPRSMTVILKDQWVDQCKPGDQILVTGIVERRWKPLWKGEKCHVELVLEALNIEHIHNSGSFSLADTLADERWQAEFERFWLQYQHQPLRGRDVIVRSFCPKLYGLHVIKLAVLLVLMGGVQKTEGGMKLRGESHLLLVGDPGTGKSQFLKYASKLMPRSVLTTGIGSTTAGLTCTAVKDSGEWHLEAGALVLADGGLCCIDEFGSIRPNDKTAIHEAMEQQTLSVAKAGLICKLNTRCSILAATNPKGNYDCQQSMEVNVNLSTPLLSRFDLIFVMLDARNESWDRTVSSFILNSEIQGKTMKEGDTEHEWDMKKLKAYLTYCKRTFHPKISSDAEQILSKYYQRQRKTDLTNSSRTTIRMLESLIRLCQAHARLMCRHEATRVDAVTAIYLMECTIHSTHLFEAEAIMHQKFPDDPDQMVQRHELTVLEKLQLDHLISPIEL